MELRALRPGELERWIQHCTAVFTGEADSETYFRDHVLCDPGHDWGGMFIAEDEGKIVASAQVFRRKIFIKGEAIPMGGIAEVATLPAYRKMGLSGKLLRLCIDYMNNQGLPISLLFTGLYEHYARYGWFTTYRRYVELDCKTAGGLPEGSHLAPLRASDIPAVRALYRNIAPSCDGALLRAHPGYWEKWLRGAWKNPLVLRQRDKVLAYMDVWEREDTMTLMDYGAQPGGNLFAPMLAECARNSPHIAHVHVPAPLMPAKNGPFIQQPGTMFRLNAPFTLRGVQIDTAGKLAQVLGDIVFWLPDAF